MGTEYLQEAEQNKALLTELCKGLAKLPPDDSSGLTELKKDLENRLKKLRTALSSLYDLRNRDKTGANPNLQGNYQIHLEDIEEVGTYCATQLLQNLEQLRDRLGELGEPEAADIVEDLIRNMAEQPRAVDLRQSHRQEAARSLSENRGAYSNTREPEEEPRERPVVVVTPDLLERLQSRQKRLGEYIQGYINCQKFYVQVQQIYPDFDIAQKRGVTRDEWNRVRDFVKEIFAAVDALGSSFEGDGELRDSLMSLQGMVKRARELCRLAVATDETTKVLVGHLADMHNPLDNITTLCPNRANATLGELRDVMNQILGQMERQRGARYHTSERAVEREDMTKIGRKPRLTSDSAVGKER